MDPNRMLELWLASVYPDEACPVASFFEGLFLLLTVAMVSYTVVRVAFSKNGPGPRECGVLLLAGLLLLLGDVAVLNLKDRYIRHIRMERLENDPAALQEAAKYLMTAQKLGLLKQDKDE